MINYLGDFAPAATVRSAWNSSDSYGASITRSTNGTISVYKDGGTTQSTAGVTDTEDFDSLTGVHLVAIDTSADGTFYSAGSDFVVVLSAATIDTRTVNAALFGFSLNNRTALRPTTAGRTLDVSTGGEAGVDLANVGSPTTTVNLSGTTIKTATDLETKLDTVDNFLDTEIAAILAAVDTEIAAIKAKTDLIPGTIDGKTFSELVTLIAAVLLGKASGLATTTAVYRAVDDSKARVTAQVDGDGNRSSVSLDAS